MRKWTYLFPHFLVTSLPNLYFFYSYVMLFCITIWSTDTGICLVSIIISYFFCFLIRINNLRRMSPVFLVLLISPRWVGMKHWLINSNAKCRHLKKITCKGTLWQVFIRFYWQEIVMFVFLPSFVSCCSSNLLSGSTLPFVNKYTRIQCARVGYEVIWGGLRQINNWRKVPLQVNFFRMFFFNRTFWRPDVL